MKKGTWMRRCLALALSVLMAFSSIPIEGLAAEFSGDANESVQETIFGEATATEEGSLDDTISDSQPEQPQVTEESTPDIPSEETTEAPTEDPADDVTEATEDNSVPEEEPTENPTEESTEAEEPTEESTEAEEPTEESTEAEDPDGDVTDETEEETTEEEPTEDDESTGELYITSADGLWLYEIVDGYAVVMGYTNQEVQSLTIPYQIDGYFVNGIGEKAFANNPMLSELSVHGNVTWISYDAFSGLGVTLSGYNGTRVLRYAAEMGLPCRNLSTADFGAYGNQVIDYTYAASNRYSLIGDGVMNLGAPEAAQLSVGSVFYVPAAGEAFGQIYEVTSLLPGGAWVEVSFVSVDSEPAEDPDSEENPTEEEQEIPEEGFTLSSDGLWLYEVVDGYAVVMGYTDYAVLELSIPYQIDGYFVNGIGEKAFVENTMLSSLYVHGNVVSIAQDAFEGLAVTLSGYNGTTVLSYANSKGIPAYNKTNVEYFTFTDCVIDYSYVGSGRYYILSDIGIRMGAPEAAQLSVGSIFYIPEVIGELKNAYQVTALYNNGYWVDVAFIQANYEDAIISVSMENIALTPDWSRAVWSDEVELVEEKYSGSWTMGVSQNIKFEHTIKKQPKITFTAEGKLGITGTASFDYSVFTGSLNELSVIAEPALTFKGELAVESGLNTNDADYLKSQYESINKDGSSFDIYICKVPLISVAHVVEIQAAVYFKVEINGKITVTLKGSGQMGIKYNKAKESFEGVNTWKWSDPTVEVSGNLAIGPAEALSLDIAFFGSVMKIELFEAFTGQAVWSTEHIECFDLNVGYKISLTINLKIPIMKSSKWSTNTDITLLEKTGQISVLHFEIKDGGLHLVYPCSYKDAFTVEFNTDCPTSIESQKINGGEQVEEPTISFIGHTLDGWYKDKQFTKKWDFENDTVTDDLTLYAKWIGTTKTVTYVTNYDKEDFTAEQEVGRTIPKPADLMWIDHRFGGWYKDAALTEAWDFSTDTMPDSDLTLYAKWTEEIGYDPYEANNVSSGEKTFNGHSYTHIMTYMSFSEAKAYAEARGGYLATINSAEEQAFLAQYLYNDCAQTYLWLGMTNGYNWDYWMTGEKVGYTNWNSDPITSGSQYNAALIRSSGKWTTLSNSETAHFVIEWGPYVADPAAGAQNENKDIQYTFDASTKTATVTGWNTDSADLVISDSYNGYPVTAIASNAFKNNTTVQTISIPNSVTSIGDNAFYGCTGLKSIVIPNSVTSMGSSVFRGATSLAKVTWSGKLTGIPGYSFYGCSNLEAISNIGKVTVIDEYAFYNCHKLSSFTYPSCLQTIGQYAFGNNYALTNGCIPDTVTSMGRYAFYNCNSLSAITVPCGITTISGATFYNCSGATSIVIPRSVTQIDSSAFNYVNGTFKVYLGSYAETWCVSKGKTYVLLGSSTSRVSFDTGLSYNQTGSAVKDGTLVDDAYIEAGKRITEPEVSVDGYTLVGWYTDPEYTNQWDFARDTVAEENITLYAKWTQDEAAFAYTVADGKATIVGYNSSNENVLIPETLGGYPTYAIAEEAFSSDSITYIQIPSCVKQIASGAFGLSPNLYEIEVPGSTSFKVVDGVLYTYAGERLIYAPQARPYISYTVLSNTSTIAKRAFANHPELKKIMVPDSVTTIASDAFEGNHDLTIYGSLDTCQAMTFAETYAYAYNLYKVNFYNGSDFVYQANIQAGHLIEDFYAPTEDFLNFAGWYKDEALTEQWNFEEDLMPAADMNLYLKFTSDFTVVPYGVGVNVTGYTGTLANVVIPETIYGYTVLGITENAIPGGIVKVTIPDCVVTIADNAIPSGVTIVGDEGSAAQTYAEANGNTFEVRKYVVTFDSLGGSEVASISVTPGSAFTLPVPVRTNYYFAGWYQNTGYSVEWTSETLMPDEDITLYALWRIANNNITDGFSYQILADGTVEITAYSGSKASLTIPETINGYTVSRIGEFAFKNNATLLTVTIPGTITSIGDYAFADSAVRIVKGCENVRTIGNYAFSGALGLRTFEWTQNLRVIGEGAFFGCSNLFEAALPEGLTTIGAKAFMDCTELYSVAFPSTLKSIGSQAFQNTDLAAAALPSEVKNQVVGVFDDDVQITFVAGSTLLIQSIKQISKTTVQISWNEIEGATGYILSRKDEGAASFKKIKTITETRTMNYSLVAGKTYTYQITAINAANEEIAVSNEIEIVITEFNLPVINSVVQDSASTAIMRLKKLSGVDGYQVYRSYSLHGEYTFLKDITSNTTTNTGLVGGGDYYYKVRAFIEENGERRYSDWSEVYYFHMPFKFMTAPENVTAYQSSASTVNISWDAVEGADAYYLYRSVDGGNYTKVKSVTDTWTQNYNLTKGTVYSYKVQAYFADSTGTVAGNKSDSAKVTILDLATPVITDITQKTGTTAVISWSKVSGAEGYALYRATERDGRYGRIKDVTELTAENYSLTQGQTYYYKVRAHKTGSDGSTVYGGYSPAYAIAMNYLSKAEISGLEQTEASTAKLTWNSVSGAAGYEVWASVNGNSDYEMIKDLTGKNLTVTDLIDGTTYFYKVRAYMMNADEKGYGDFSDPVSIQCIGSPTISVLEQSSESAAVIMWSRVADAAGYELWRSVDGAAYAKVKTITGNTTNNYSLKTGSTYSYKIRAFRTTQSGEKIYGFYSEPASLKVIATPSISSIKQDGSSYVTIKWNEVANAEGYVLYRSNLADGVYTAIKTVTATSTQNYSLDTSTVYYYKVAAYVTVDGVKQYSMPSAVRYITVLEKPEISEIEQLSSTSVKITWTPVEKATGYKLYRAEEENGTYSCIKAITDDLSTSSYNLTAEKYYYYKVAAYVDEDGTTHTAPMSSAEGIYVTNLAKPTISGMEQSSATALTLKWGTVSNAVGYEVFLAESEDGAYERVATTTSKSFSNTELTTGNTYYYKVRAYKTVDGKKAYGPFSAVAGATILEKAANIGVAQASKTSAVITWDPVENATGYKLYRATSSDGTYSCIKTVTENAAFNYNLTTGSTYYYRVQAIVENGSIANSGPRSAAKSLTLCDLDNAKIVSASQSGETTVQLTWDEVSGAEGYELSKADSENGAFAVVKSVTTTSTSTSAGLTLGNSYWYRVRAYKTVDGSKLYGGYSETVRISLLAATEIEYLYQASNGAISMTWKAVADADGYEVRRNKNGEAYSLLARTEDLGYTDDTIDVNSVYSYKVRPYQVINGKKSYGAYSEEVALQTLALTNTPYPESEHNYSNSMDQTWTYTIAGAEALLLKFNSSCYTESYDYVYVMDKDGAVVGKYNGSTFANTVVKVTGDTVQIRMTSDGSVTYYGFGFDFIAPTFVDSTSGSMGDVNWTLQGNTLTFSGEGSIDATFKGNTKVTSVIIGAGITEISANAFQNCTNLKSVTMANDVVSIGNYAFYGCSRLSAINLSNSLTSLGSYAFYGNSVLESIVIPNGVTSIGNHAFYNCSKMASASLPTALLTIGSYAFCNDTALNNLVIPSGVTTLGNYAFSNCTGLTKLSVPATVTTISEYTFNGIGATTAGPAGGGYGYEYGWTGNIPNYAFSRMTKLTNATVSGVTGIGSNAFRYCTALTTVNVGSGVTCIETHAFYGDTELTAISLPSGVTSIGNYAFYNCSKLASVSLPTTLLTIGSYAFCNDVALNNLVIPNGATTLGNYAFSNCTGLTKLSVPATVTSISEYTFNGIGSTTAGPAGGGYGYEYGWTGNIPNYAFSHMTKLTNATVSGVTGIGAHAFRNCTALTTVNVGSGVTSVETHAFYGDTELIAISLPSGVTSIGSYAFHNCTKLASVSLPTTLLTIGSYAFCNDVALNNLVIPNGATTLGNYAFSNCTGLTKLSVPATVTSMSEYTFNGIGATTVGPAGGGYGYEYGWTGNIPNYAFSRMTKLTNATVSGVTGIGSNAFRYCTALTTVSVGSGVTTIGSYAFYYCSKLESVSLPSTLLTIDAYAFYGNSVLNNVNIPSGVTSLGNYAFAYCTGMNKISIPDSVTSISTSAFNGSSNVVIYCSSTSYAAEYAQTKGIAYVIQ